MKRKLVVNDGRSEREVLLVGPIVIGRDPSCHISDLDPLLSRRHAEFVPRPSGLLVRDLGSRNGILVNGAKVPERLLASGDVVQLGHLQLRYIEEEITELHDVRHAEDTEPHESATFVAASKETDKVPTSVMRELATSADATIAPTRRPAPNIDTTQVAGSNVDTTRISGLDAALLRSIADDDDDDTHIPTRKDDDETMAPHSISLSRAVAPDEAQLVVDADLVVRSTSPTGQLIFGVRPEALIGRSLSEAVERSVGVLAGAKGRPTLALFATCNESDKTIKVTFKAGQAVEPVK
ncbi:MAG: FHA domain-containing protein [Vicinamibacterales bacterium]